VRTVEPSPVVLGEWRGDHAVGVWCPHLTIKATPIILYNGILH
jgi:hypothetical protein